MTVPYRVVDVSGWDVLPYDEIGTKQKAWLHEPSDRERRKWLFKRRLNESTGDDWAERIAGECAGALTIPHATVELASRNGTRGVVILSFIARDRGDDLRLANELMRDTDSSYDDKKLSRLADYTLERAFAVLQELRAPAGWPLPRGVVDAADVFTGYLLLDALIANQDRNHRNWGRVQRSSSMDESHDELTPSFDHGSSLGRNLSDDERAERLATRDHGYAISAFASKAKCRFRIGDGSRRHATTFDAFRWALARRPAVGKAWLDELRRVDDVALRAMVLAVPATLMSACAMDFTARLLILNRATLLASLTES